MYFPRHPAVDFPPNNTGNLPVSRPLLLSLLVPVIFLLVLGGCAAPRRLADVRRGSAADILSESLKVHQNTKSYRFTADGSIRYLDMADRGNFSLTGQYLAPGRSHMTMELMLGNATYYSEILYTQQTMYQILADSWRKVSFNPNTLMQPGFHPVNLLIDQIGMLAVNPSFDSDEEYQGKKLIVVKAISSPRKIRSYLQKELAKTADLEPDRRTGLMNFLSASSISQQYTLYIDPDTKQIVKLVFLQVVKINLSGKISETQLSTTYYLSDFGADVDIPGLPGQNK